MRTGGERPPTVAAPGAQCCTIWKTQLARERYPGKIDRYELVRVFCLSGGRGRGRD